MPDLRILSLLPSATEIVYLLGLQNQLVGVSHECNFPPGALKKPKITSSSITCDLSSIEIDRRVKKLIHKGNSVFHINEKKLRSLKPDLILTQEVCLFCAVGFKQANEAARVLESEANIISLEPQSIGDVLNNILLVGKYTKKTKKSVQVVKTLQKRLNNIASKLNDSKSLKPKILMIEWLNPLMVAGHWVPQMVEKTGGINLISKNGEKSYPINKDQLVKSNPDIVVFAPCGFSIIRTLREKSLIENIINLIPKSCSFFLVDGNSYLTRPGPRLIDGVEILSEIIHPNIFPRKHKKSDWVRYY